MLTYLFLGRKPYFIVILFIVNITLLFVNGVLLDFFAINSATTCSKFQNVNCHSL
jgi:hypothetical protein